MWVANPVVQSVVRRLYPYGSIRKVLFGRLRGTRFLVEPSMGFTYALGGRALNWGFLEKQIAPGMVVYDIGANRGQMTLFFAALTGPTGKVLSFEPVKALSSVIERNLSLNGFVNVDVQPVALADFAGRSAFIFSQGRSTQGCLIASETHDCQPTKNEAIDVDVERLDSLTEGGFPLPSLIKVDVEGAAAAVLCGAKRTIEKASPSIYIELHGPEEQRAVRDLQQSFGYCVQTLDGVTVADPTGAWHSPLWCFKASRLPSSVPQSAFPRDQ